MRIDNPSKAETLLKRRRAQIERAYQARLKPKMSKAARRALEDERTRQLALARSEFTRLSHAKPKKPKVTAKVVPRFVENIKPAYVAPKPKKPVTGSRKPIGGIPTLVTKRRVKAYEGPDQPVEHAVSPHWKYQDAEGRPVEPWSVEVGPVSLPRSSRFADDDDEGALREAGFADEDYSYEDLETDWGGYDHQDTGYADENA